MPTFAPAYLEDLTARVLVGLGATEPEAEVVAASLVLSNLVGHDSHGVIRLLQYPVLSSAGQVKPAQPAEVARRQGLGRRGGRALGVRSACRPAGDGLANEVAYANGVAAVTIDRCNHVGRLGEYVAAMAAAGKGGHGVVQFRPASWPLTGGPGRVMGTNPLAWAVPRAGGPEIVVDFATSSVAEGKLVLARAAGRARSSRA